METNSNQTPKTFSKNSRQKGKQIKADSIKLNPQFDSLEDPKTFINHVEDIKKSKTISHADILDQLILQIVPLNFEELANPNNVDNFKCANKHYIVLCIEDLQKVASKNHWGLCKHHDFIYLFNGSYWDQIDKEAFQKFLGKAAEKMGVPKFSARHYKFRKELYEQFISTAYLEQKNEEIDKVLINLQNGTFEVSPEGKNLRPFDRSDFLTYRLPFSYDPKVKAPLFQKYLNEVLPDEERQKVLAEYLGYVFIKHGSNRLKVEKALILYGTGANGKSVFFEIVSALLGDKNTSNYSLQSLTNDNGYYRAKLANRLVNYGSEINGKLESAIFKQLVSGEPVEARLPYGEPFAIRQYAKLIFNCNELPRDVEQTDAYFRRFLIIPFDVTIPSNKQDNQLHNKIIESELSGVFNWVLDGLNRLLEQKRFTECKAAFKALQQYKTESDSVKMFIQENNYQNDANENWLIKDLYTDYRSFCIEDGFKPVNKTNFIKRLKGMKVLIERQNRGYVAYLSNGKKQF